MFLGVFFQKADRPALVAAVRAVHPAWAGKIKLFPASEPTPPDIGEMRAKQT